MPSIMVVEDDPTFAATVAAHLNRAGFEVEVVQDTFAALNRVDARHFDVLLVDIGMPGGKPSGLSFARMMRLRHPSSRVIFMTGYLEFAEAAVDLPAKVFTKPVNLDDIVAEIRTQLAN